MGILISCAWPSSDKYHGFLKRLFHVKMLQYPSLMSYVPFTTVLFSFLGVLLYYFISSQKTGHSGIRFPPGPPGLPIIGNVLSLATSHPWKRFASWSTTYGARPPKSPVLFALIHFRPQQVLSCTSKYSTITLSY